MELLQLLGLEVPIIQAPMAGVSTPRMAAAVSNAGALGSIGIGAVDAQRARRMISDVRDQCARAFNVNVFCHERPRKQPEVNARWIARLQPQFERFEAPCPTALSEIYGTFLDDEEMLAMLVQEKPRVVSFHFGLPSDERIRALREAGIVLLACVTNLAEGLAAMNGGVHAVVAQGYEAGGHRGIFDPQAQDDCLGTLPLTRLLVRKLDIPVIAAGGIMDGAGIAAVLRLGAAAAQLGTAFIACDESDADSYYRAALASDAANHTVMTRAISGRPARCLANAFTNMYGRVAPEDIPAYPCAYDAGKALNAAAKKRGEGGFGAQWAGQGAPLARSLPATKLIATLVKEMH
jgi:nitronate monooxygenase